MCAKPVCYDSPSRPRRPTQRLRFARIARPKDKMKDAMVALDVIFRPSIQLWKLALSRSALKDIAFKRPKRVLIASDDTSSASSSMTLKKTVRFDEQPVTITRRNFFERCRRDSSSSPARPCLVIREYDDLHRQPPEQSPPEMDSRSMYEDCFSDYPGFFADLQILDPEGDDECLDTRPPKSIRRSEFYETESGIATFDRAGYANYCLTKWLEKQREAARAPEKRMFEGLTVHTRSCRRTLSPQRPASERPDAIACCMSSLCSAPVHGMLRPLPWRMWKRIEDELQNAIAVLIIGLFIHTCLFLFLLYDILARGFVPSDD